MMRRMFAALLRYRPRVLTLVVLAAIAATIVLANLSEEFRPRNAQLGVYPVAESDLEFDLREPRLSWRSGSTTFNMSYGWPLLWRQYVIVLGYGAGVVDSNYSAGRLAGNIALWTVMLAAPTAACEWLLRRYRPRLRWSLRTMLVAMGCAAALCAWFAAARNRATVQDPLIAASNAHGGRVWVQHWGPRWLDLFGAERFGRRIIGAKMHVSLGDEEADQEGKKLLAQVRRLHDLQYLHLRANRLTPGMADALRELRRLQTLRIEIDELSGDSGLALAGALSAMRRLRVLSIGPGSFGPSNDGLSHNCLAAIGAAAQLEHLRLAGETIDCEDLACLAGLTNLKSLTLEAISSDADEPDSGAPLLSRLPALPRLEALDLTASDVREDDLRYVALLPRLKALNLVATRVTGAGLKKLGPLEPLEELAISDEAVSLAGLESLLALRRLKKLHIEGFDQETLQTPGALREQLSYMLEDERQGLLRAMEALPKSNPGLVVDGAVEALEWPEEMMVPSMYDSIPGNSFEPAARQALRGWKEKQAGK